MKKLIKEIKLLTFTIPEEKLQKEIHSSLLKEGKNIEQDEDPKEILPSLHKVGKSKKHVVSSFNKAKEQKEPKETLPFLPQVSFPSKANVSPIIPENVNSIKAVPNQESSSSYLNKHTQKSIPKKSPSSFKPKSEKTLKEIQMEEDKKQRTQRYHLNS